MASVRSTAVVVALTVIAAPAIAQQQPPKPSTAAATPAPATPAAGQHTLTAPPPGPTGSLEKSHDAWRANILIGATVYNDGGEDIGTVDDLLIGDDGKLTIAVISVGGFLGIGNKLVSVPYDQVKLKPSKGNAGPAGGPSNSSVSRRPQFSIVIPGATKQSLTKMTEFKY